jgi:transcriptional regulator with GAF, ATPase, and Fis domain
MTQLQLNGRNHEATPSHGHAGLHLRIAESVRNAQAEPQPNPDRVLKDFMRLASTHLRGVSHASAMVVTGKQNLRASPASDAVPQLIDEIQEKLLEGPCIDAVAKRQTISVNDLADETRWPGFTSAVLTQTPVRCLLAFPLYTNTDDCGGLSLYANTPYAFDSETEELGELLACHAAITLSYVRRSREFRSALGNRDLIGQAKGRLMERYNISGGAAFSLLARLSEQAHKPVVAVAKELAGYKATGTPQATGVPTNR